jgi:hypothetical protein
MSRDPKTPVSRDAREIEDASEVSAHGEIDAFLQQARAMTSTRQPGVRGRLIFALDATMSRQPTWDSACTLQALMFHETAGIGGLDVQLVYFRGFGECRASRWVDDPRRLADLMTRIDCRGGATQIRKVLRHARSEAGKKPVQALVYIGDSMEESVDELCALAGELGLLGVPAFMFHEGNDPIAGDAFREIARLTKGAYCRFDTGAAQQLRELLSAVAVYAAGGRAALEDYGRKGGREARLLIEQMR